MTVQELINKLVSIEDKSLKIFVYNCKGTLGDIEVSDVMRIALDVNKKDNHRSHDADLRKYRGHDVEIVKGVVIKANKGYEKDITGRIGGI